MTTQIKIGHSGHLVRVETFDNGEKTAEQLIEPGSPEVTLYCTTTREIRIVDLEPAKPEGG